MPHACFPIIEMVSSVETSVRIFCWSYRLRKIVSPPRKGGGRCYAIDGDNRYHSIFGGSVSGGCLAVHPSDTAPALIALDAMVKTSKRTISAERFFEVGIEKTTVLDMDEIVTEITIPKSAEDSGSAFVKFAARKTIDFHRQCAAQVSSPEKSNQIPYLPTQSMSLDAALRLKKFR
jgi:xanthine dehydrogenase YagS FAD-binding subunit